MPITQAENTPDADGLFALEKKRRQAYYNTANHKSQWRKHQNIRNAVGIYFENFITDFYKRKQGAPKKHCNKR